MRNYIVNYSRVHMVAGRWEREIIWLITVVWTWSQVDGSAKLCG